MTAVSLLSLLLAAPVPAVPTDGTPFVAWREEIGAGVRYGVTRPLVVGGRVIVGTDTGELRAYAADTGERRWTCAHGKRIYHEPTADAGRVFFTSEAGLTAAAADTGEERWAFPIPQGGGPTAVLPGRGWVVVGGGNGTLYAVDATTGANVWESDFLTDAPPDPPGFEKNQFRANAPARPCGLAADATGVYLSVFDQSRVIAYDAATGKRRWSYQTGGWVGDPVIAGDRVLIGSQDKQFYCLDAATGRPVWKFPCKGATTGGLATDGQSVYFGGADGGMYALRLADGTPRWRFQTAADPNYWAGLSVPMLRRGAAYFGCSDGHLYAVETSNGTLRWKHHLPAEGQGGCSGPAVDEKRFFVTRTARQLNDGESSLIAIGLK